MAAPSWDSLAPAKAPSWDALNPAQAPAPSGGSVPEDPRPYFSGDGFLSRVGNFLHRADQMSERGAHGLVSGLERTGQAAANAVGLDTVGNYLGGQAAENEAAAAAPVPGATSWEQLKADPSLGNIASYIGEQAAGATPGLGAAAVALPAFAASRLGDVAEQRAQNNGEQAPGIMDLLKAAPSAAVDTVLMRGGLNAILKGSIGKAAVREGIAQAGMPAADYAGATVGTNKPFSWAELGDQAAAGLVAGLPLGAGMHLGVRGTRALRELYATKGVDTSGMSDDALTEGSLNGSIHPEVGPDQVNAILQSVGSAPEHFSTPERAASAAERVKARTGFDPSAPGHIERELAAVEDTESGGDPNAVSPKGARGSMQTMPGTLRDPGFGVRPAANDSPEEMRRVGRDYYTALRDHYGNAAKAFAAYNAGPGALDGAVRKYGADWLEHMPQETRNYVRTNLDKIGGEPRETVYRAPPPTEDAFASDSGFERTDRPESPLRREGLGESFTATGDSSRPFMEETDTPAGEEPGFWERRAEMQADDLRKEWEASRQEPPPASEDPAARYGANGYGQRPHMPDGSDAFAMTQEGHIADAKGKPVAFRNVKDAATFAAKNKLGGDFEPKVWATNSTRVVLTRREGSTYGERPVRPEGPQEPPAGRSADTSQRAITDAALRPQPPENGPGRPQNEPPAPEPGPAAPSAAPEPEMRAEEPVLRAESGSETDQDVPRGTENAPAPRNFMAAVADHLASRSKSTGMRVRLSAEDAINHGVAADSIFINPKAKYPRLKIWAQKVFATNKAPLNSRAVPTKTISLDNIGDVFHPDQFGVPGDELHGHRIEPEHAGQLLQQSIDRDPAAFDRHDDRYEPHMEQRANEEAQGREEQERDTIREVASQHGIHLSDDDVSAALEHRASGESHQYAIEAAMRHAAAKVLDTGADETANEFYRSVADGIHEGEFPEQRGEGPAEAGERSEGERVDTDRGSEGSEEPAGSDLIPGRDTDQRDALQRRADDRLKPSAEQKPAGSDGGLFDTRDTTGDLLDGEKPPKRGIGGTLKELWENEDGSLNIGKIADAFLERDADPAEIVRKMRDLVRSPAKTTKAALKALDRFGSVVAYSSDGALRTLARHYNSPTIEALANMFQARAGAPDATGRTYDEALKRSNGRFRSRLDKALDPFLDNKPALERIRDLLTDPDRTVRSTAQERAAAREIRDLLNDVIAYRKEAGEDIGEVKNYFPRVVDTLAVANEPAKFKAAAEKLYREMGVDDPAAAAESWMTRLLDTHAGLDGGEEFLVSSGKPSSSKAREFGPAADKLLRDFYQKDPLLVLSDYVTGSVRRAEQTRRFGAKGAVNSKERGEWMKEHGDKTQWDVMVDKMRDEVRASGEDADGVIRQIKAIRDGSMGRLGTTGVRVSRAVSTIHAWNQLSTLQRVTLSSIGDLAMGFVRGGPKYGVRHFATSLKEAARLVEAFGKRDLSDAHRWAEAMGTVGHGTASQLIQARMDAAPGAVQHAALLNKFYHKVGIEQLTQGGRIAATENAKVFLDTLAGDLMSKSARTRQRATLYMKELGIKDPQSFGQWLRGGPPSESELAADRGHAADYATAVVRFADQTVLMPSRAQKPVWANHPVGSLVFALQSYNAAFTQNVLKRVGRLSIEGVKSKDPALFIPATGLVVLAGMNALQTYLRTALFGGKQPDDPEAFALQVMDRTGLTGMASPFFNALYGTKYHRSISQSLQGSVIGRVGQAADAAAGLVVENSKNTNTAERKAAGMLYDLAIDPAINAFGAKYLRGAAGTAAIMGTGNKRGGALPGDRDAFIDAVAGKEKKRVSSGE